MNLGIRGVVSPSLECWVDMWNELIGLEFDNLRKGCSSAWGFFLVQKRYGGKSSFIYETN
jgi:hypothetical protein